MEIMKTRRGISLRTNLLCIAYVHRDKMPTVLMLRSGTSPSTETGILTLQTLFSECTRNVEQLAAHLPLEQS